MSPTLGNSNKQTLKFLECTNPAPIHLRIIFQFTKGFPAGVFKQWDLVMHLDLYSLRDNKIEPFKECGNSSHYCVVFLMSLSLIHCDFNKFIMFVSLVS